MEKKTIVITGSSDGIGAAAARKLKAMGHNVIIVGRNKEKTEKIAKEIDAPFHLVDYSELNQVKRLAEELKKYDKFDVLVNNAGGAQNERKITIDGYEKTYQINHLSSFLLTNLLIDKLCESKATVIQTTSIAANIFGKNLDINDLNNERNYTSLMAYGNSKLENILFTRELNKRYKDKGINAVAFEPGIVRSNFGTESKKIINFFYHSAFKYLFTISPEKSAERLIKLAIGIPGEDFVCGETYSGKKIMKINFKDGDGSIARELWDKSSKMIEKYIIKKGELEFHKSRVAFMIIDSKIYFLENSNMSHKEWYLSLGYDIGKFEDTVKGYYREGNIVFYKGDFIYDEQVIKIAKEYSSKVKEYVKDFNAKVFVGVVKGKVGEIWQPDLEIKSE